MGTNRFYIRHAAKKVQEKCGKERWHDEADFMFWRFKYVWTGSGDNRPLRLGCALDKHYKLKTGIAGIPCDRGRTLRQDNGI